MWEVRSLQQSVQRGGFYLNVEGDSKTSGITPMEPLLALHSPPQPPWSHTHTLLCAHAYTHVLTHMFIHTLMRTHTHISMLTRACLHTCSNTHSCSRVHMLTLIHTCSYTHSCIHMLTHTHAHTHLTLQQEAPIQSKRSTHSEEPWRGCPTEQPKISPAWGKAQGTSPGASENLFPSDTSLVTGCGCC